jgi:hypothetical protein
VKLYAGDLPTRAVLTELIRTNVVRATKRYVSLKNFVDAERALQADLVRTLQAVSEVVRLLQPGGTRIEFMEQVVVDASTTSGMNRNVASAVKALSSALDAVGTGNRLARTSSTKSVDHRIAVMTIVASNSDKAIAMNEETVTRGALVHRRLRNKPKGSNSSERNQ